MLKHFGLYCSCKGCHVSSTISNVNVDVVILKMFFHSKNTNQTQYSKLEQFLKHYCRYFGSSALAHRHCAIISKALREAN